MMAVRQALCGDQLVKVIDVIMDNLIRGRGAKLTRFQH